ncbi:FxLYD domain-containing protein [Thermodesulfobacteriota bacterium]
MRRSDSIAILIAVFMVLGFCNNVHAEITTVTVPFEDSKWLSVELRIGGVEITNIILVPPGNKGVIRLPRGNDPQARVNIKNNSEVKANDIGIAVALLDAQGKLIGVASGKTGKIPPGQIDEITMPFKNVNTFFMEAADILISMESESF